MKLVLSRKGFDAENGGYPSPILPDGTLLSIPIPMAGDPHAWTGLRGAEGTYAKVMADLGILKKVDTDRCHLDPDLVPGIVPRLPGWRPSFGQSGAAQSHLANHHIGTGDIFLFFGWFRETELRSGKLRFKPKAPNLHVLFGWLSVGPVLLDPKPDEIPDWLRGHPHTVPPRLTESPNAIYVAADACSLVPELPGGGVFRRADELVLTVPGLSRSRWALPPEVFRHLKISHHTPDSWKKTHFDSAKIGQEFIVSPDGGAVAWARGLLQRNA